MHFMSTLAGAALFLGAEASAVPRQDPHITDYRVWSNADCAQNGNLGVGTITKSQTNECQTWFADDNIRAMRLNDLEAGCEVFVYPTADCGEGAKKIGVNTCEGFAGERLLSFKVSCA